MFDTGINRARRRLAAHGWNAVCIHGLEAPVNNIINDMPPLYVSFYSDDAQPTCDSYGAAHPG